MTGWLGMLMVLAAYLLLSNKLIADEEWFHGLTGLGSLLLIVHNWGNWPMVILSAVFVAASLRWFWVDGRPEY